MNIVFQPFLDDPDLMDNFSLEKTIELHHVYKYVEERLSVLKDEIELEESQGYKRIIICYEKGVGFQDYSLQLKEKMHQCFPKSEIDFLTKEINAKISRLLN